MGADFIFAAAEMPPVPTLQGRGLHHDDPAKDAIVSRLRVAIIRDQELLTDLLEQDYYSILEENASKFGVDVDWDNHSLILAWGLLGQPLRTHTSMCVSLMMRVSVAASRLFTHTQTHHKEDEAPRQHSA